MKIYYTDVLPTHECQFVAVWQANSTIWAEVMRCTSKGFYEQYRSGSWEGTSATWVDSVLIHYIVKGKAL